LLIVKTSCFSFLYFYGVENQFKSDTQKSLVLPLHYQAIITKNPINFRLIGFFVMFFGQYFTYQSVDCFVEVVGMSSWISLLYIL